MIQTQWLLPPPTFPAPGRTTLCHCPVSAAVFGDSQTPGAHLVGGRALHLRHMGPAHALRELPGSTPQTSPRRAGRESDLTNDSFILKASAILGITRSPSQASSGRPSGGTGKVFTFVEGLISVKDDRAPASENHVCMGFFFFFSSKHSGSQEVRYSARQKSRSASGGEAAAG